MRTGTSVTPPLCAMSTCLCLETFTITSFLSYSPEKLPCQLLRQVADHFKDYFQCTRLAVHLDLPDARHAVATLKKANKEVNPSDVAFKLLLQWRHTVDSRRDTLYIVLRSYLSDLPEAAKLLSFPYESWAVPPPCFLGTFW